MKQMGKKGFQISDMSGIGISFVVTAIVLAIGATILTSIQIAGNTNGANTSAVFNQTGYGLGALSTIGSYLPTVALVSVAAVVVGIVLVYLAGRK